MLLKLLNENEGEMWLLPAEDLEEDVDSCFSACAFRSEYLKSHGGLAFLAAHIPLFCFLLPCIADDPITHS